jgi:hypothetical protein
MEMNDEFERIMKTLKSLESEIKRSIRQRLLVSLARMCGERKKRAVMWIFSYDFLSGQRSLILLVLQTSLKKNSPLKWISSQLIPFEKRLKSRF